MKYDTFDKDAGIRIDDCAMCQLSNVREDNQRDEIIALQIEIRVLNHQLQAFEDEAKLLRTDKRGWIGMCCLIGAIAMMALGQACGWVKP